MEPNNISNIQPLTNAKPLFWQISIVFALLVLSSWIHFPFAPIPWNCSLMITVLISTVTPLNVVQCALPLWILAGHYASSWMFPYIANPNGPWGGYIWGLFLVAHITSKLTQKKIHPIWVWMGALFTLESVSALQYWCMFSKLGLTQAKQAGLCALLPWHMLQSILGLSLGRHGTRLLRILLKCPKVFKSPLEDKK